MDRSEICRRVLSVVEREYGTDSPNEGTDIFNDIGLDSFSFILFMVEVEKEFSIALIDRDVEWHEITHIRNLVDLVEGVVSGS